MLDSSLSPDGILCLTLNDPNRCNALSEALLATLGAAFDAAKNNPDVRVIILAAVGPVFCAGHDLKNLMLAAKILIGDEPISPNFKSMLICDAEHCHLSKTCDC